MEKNQNDEEIVPYLKITLIGDTGAGKTCIINRYINDDFFSNKVSTMGVSCSNKLVKEDNKLLRVDLWDTAGQEQYRSLGRHFYKDSYVIILVYDITNRESFENLKIVWYKDLLKYNEKYTILAVVGNKNDLYEIEKVSEDEGRNYAKEINAIFMLVSAKNGDNINNLFNDIVNLYWEPIFQEKVDEMSNKDNGSVRLKKGFKKEEEMFKSKPCC
jgi:small GTP-binding protein